MPTTHITLIFPLLLFTSALCQDPATRPKLYLYNTALSNEYLAGDFATLPLHDSHTVMNGNRNMASNPVLKGIVTHAKAYCSDGVWRFYPKKNFLLSQDSNGFTIGEGQKRVCKNIGAGSGAALASMGSYRYLGPVNWAEEFSMTVYDGMYYSGNVITVTTKGKPTSPKKIGFQVKSYVITAPVLTNSTENKKRKYCSPWIVNINDEPRLEVCFNLCSCPNNNDLPKMYMQGVYQYHSKYPFKSIKFVQDVGVDDGVGCSKTGVKETFLPNQPDNCGVKL